ncbi:MAG TPA: acyl-CoA thioesterase domain-containing protein [Acidimicrobiales bacterium]|nr:acyl-CoA thioesterase domain-containing protein [Acidimicrobiales bacterium]
MELTGAFFRPTRQGLAPAPEAHSPWSTDMLHGRLLAGLAARAVELDHSEEGFTPARLTVDLFRSPPMAPVGVASRLVRAGGRVRVAEVILTISEVEVARASAVLLRRSEPPTGRVWAPPTWSAPPPEVVAPPPDEPGRRFPMDLRPMTPGGFWAFAQKRLWAREVRALVEDEEPSPFVRVSAAADLANPLSNSGEHGLAFINADLSVYLARPPGDEWVGLEVSGHVADGGTAVGWCNLYDRQGPIGQCTVCSVANPRLSG